MAKVPDVHLFVFSRPELNHQFLEDLHNDADEGCVYIESQGLWPPKLQPRIPPEPRCCELVLVLRGWLFCMTENEPVKHRHV